MSESDLTTASTSNASDPATDEDGLQFNFEAFWEGEAEDIKGAVREAFKRFAKIGGYTNDSVGVVVLLTDGDTTASADEIRVDPEDDYPR